MGHDKTFTRKDAESLKSAIDKIVAKAWSDEAYKKRLLDQPGTVLREAGVVVPSSVKLVVVEDRADVRHIVLPEMPSTSIEAMSDSVGLSFPSLFFTFGFLFAAGAEPPPGTSTSQPPASQSGPPATSA
jgi:hypothetical protein